MIRLLVATRNAHKTREFADILGRNFALEDLNTHPEIGEIAENGATFLENAQIKALAVSGQLPGLVLADDSGLEVDSLGGAPGIFSARYASEKATDAENRQKLLRKLLGVDNRRARFVCVLALAREGKLVGSFSGEVRGEIVRSEIGAAGFGYDALFRPNECRQTFAELGAVKKNRFSHRAAATERLKKFLREFLQAEMPNETKPPPC